MSPLIFLFFFFNDTAPTEIYTLSLHDALPIFPGSGFFTVIEMVPTWPAVAVPAAVSCVEETRVVSSAVVPRSEEHTSELQSQSNLVCRLLLEKKKNNLSHSEGALHLYPLDVDY